MDTCIEIASKIEDFLHHKATWEEVLQTIHDQVDSIQAGAYFMGFKDHENGRIQDVPRVSPAWQDRFAR
jgi:hypothetical protein